MNKSVHTAKSRQRHDIRLNNFLLHVSEAATGGVCKKSVPRNFPKFTGKHLCQRLFFNKVAGLRPATLLKKVSGAGVFL